MREIAYIRHRETELAGSCPKCRARLRKWNPFTIRIADFDSRDFDLDGRLTHNGIVVMRFIRKKRFFDGIK